MVTLGREIHLVAGQHRKIRVRVYEIRPGPFGFELDTDRLHCVIEIEDGQGSFRFLDHSREKLIRSLFDSPSSRFVAGGTTPDGLQADVMETHPAWSIAAIESVVRYELYGFNLGAVIEQIDSDKEYR
jgi:hypothetical protein